MPPTDLMKKSPATNSYLNVKLVLIGNVSVGKSSLLLRFSDERWFPEHKMISTLRIDLRVHEMEVNGQKVKLSVWDTAGQERFDAIRSPYYRGAQGIILVYDVADRRSFEALPRWFSEIDPHVSTTVPKIIVGNKVDQENSRQVSTTEGSTFASRQNALFVEASAKTAVGVREIFEELVARIIETPELWAPVTPETGVGFLLAKRKEDSTSGMIVMRRNTVDSGDGSWSCAC
ncbi:ras-domain-containing protein [Suillus paluster]|uniref:ras-domain-containing protein n=1 Tax=Suillus paluster TaxID=48578 RepID=UPI001B862962|nr:ras-domain-containing protein [Suillus paluster]KAG1736091.1 ras-domain-containing protein [Suillus paluster]